jgi:hypothetical protein
MLFSHREASQKKAGSAVEDLLSQYAHLERQAAEITFRRNVIIAHTERRGVMNLTDLFYLADYGVHVLGRERAAQIARNLELSGTCPGLTDYILAL